MTNRVHKLTYYFFSSSFPIVIACMALMLTSCESKTADEYYDEGYSFALKSDYDNAIINYEKAIKKDKKFTKAMIELGNVYQNLKQKDLSLSYYDQALEIDSTLADAYYGRGMLKRNSGDEYGACTDFVEAHYYGRPYMQDYLKRCFNLYQVTPKNPKEPWEE